MSPLFQLIPDEIRSFMEEESILRFDSLPYKKFIYKDHFDKEKLFYFLDKSKVKYNRRDYLQILENLEVAERQGSKVIFNNNIKDNIFYFKQKTFFYSKNHFLYKKTLQDTRCIEKWTKGKKTA